MGVPFTRQLGARSGVQLNPLTDNTERFVSGNADQVFGIVGRFERGRFDKAFDITAGNQRKRLGNPSSTVLSKLNEAYVQTYEAFSNGAYAAVVSRLVPDTAVLSWMVARNGATTWNVEATPVAPYLVAVKHLECFNDGVIAEIHAETDTTSVVLRLRDKVDNNILYEFVGSLNPESKDEFGASNYLPNVVSAATDDVEVMVGNGAVADVSDPFFGIDANGYDKYAVAELTYFAEGGTSYELTDYDRAVQALKYTDLEFGYMISGGSRAIPLLSKMIALAKDINKQFIWDIGGEYTVEQAVTFYNQLNIDTHLSQCYFAPLYGDDPVNGGKDFIGCGGIQVGMRCARNARTDANGIAPRNFVVAGRDWSMTRTGIVQKTFFTDQELDLLAKTRINPVMYVKYTSGGRYVFFDSLTGSKTESDKKLIAVADMSCYVDDVVTAVSQESLQLPMQTGVKRLSDFLQGFFEAIEAAKWIKPSKDLGNRSFVATVAPNANRPSDRLDVGYYLRYDGTVRAIYVQQTLSK
jgi:hypothetical protein